MLEFCKLQLICTAEPMEDRQVSAWQRSRAAKTALWNAAGDHIRSCAIWRCDCAKKGCWAGWCPQSKRPSKQGHSDHSMQEQHDGMLLVKGPVICCLHHISGGPRPPYPRPLPPPRPPRPPEPRRPPLLPPGKPSAGSLPAANAMRQKAALPSIAQS